MNEPVDRTHLTDEILSLHLDGELDPSRAPAAAEHLSACSRCAARREALAAASGALRAAVVEAPSGLDARRLVDRALGQHRSRRSRAWWAGATAARRRSGKRSAAPRQVKPAGGDLRRGEPDLSARPKARSAPAIPALAAIVLAVLVATGLLSYDRPTDDEAVSGSADSRFLDTELPAEAFLGDLGDLDTLTDAASLPFLDQASPGAAASKQAPSQGDPAGETDQATTTAASAAPGGADRQSGAEEHAGGAADRLAVAAPRREASPEEAADILQCAATIELSARSSDLTAEEGSDRPSSWHLELAATGRLQGKDALFLAFERPAGGLQIFLVRRDDCSIVRFLTSPLARP